RSAFHKVDAFSGFGESENFVSNYFSDGKAIVHLGALQIPRRQIRHTESFLSCFARDRKRRRVLFIERQIIGGVTVAKQSGSLVPVAADFVQIFSGNENNRRRAISNLGTIGNFEGRRDTWVLI